MHRTSVPSDPQASNHGSAAILAHLDLCEAPSLSAGRAGQATQCLRHEMIRSFEAKSKSQLLMTTLRATPTSESRRHRFPEVAARSHLFASTPSVNQAQRPGVRRRIFTLDVGSDLHSSAYSASPSPSSSTMNRSSSSVISSPGAKPARGFWVACGAPYDWGAAAAAAVGSFATVSHASIQSA